MPSDFLERRRSLRFALVLPVDVVCVRERAVNFLGRTCNLSGCGAYFEVDGDVRPGEALEFVVTLQDVGRVQLRCRGRATRIEKLQAEGQLGVATTIRRYQFIREDSAQSAERK